MIKPLIVSKTIDELNSMNESEIKNILKKGITASYSRLDRLKNAGYEMSDYNQTFKHVMGNNKRQALGKVDSLSFEQAKARASYVRRHLMSEQSSISGMQARELRSLEMLNKLSEEPKPIRRLRNGSYRMGDDIISREDIKDFFSALRKVEETVNLQTLKGGSGDGVDRIAQMYFDKKVKNPVDLANTIISKYREEQLEESRLEAEREARLESVKSRPMKW